MHETDLSGVKPIIFSVAGTELSAEEKSFFQSEKPFGFILFARSVDNPDQLRQLISDLRSCVERSDAPVLVDQEGGRVQRMRPPHWFQAPALGKIGALYDIDPAISERAAVLATELIINDLKSVGFNVNCSPCLDLPRAETSNVIGDRALHQDNDVLVKLAATIMDYYVENGIMPVIKHIPGHGRGTVDSHHELPTVSATLEELKASDFKPFKSLSAAPWGMTAHIVFDQIDPDNPATQSQKVIEEIIRGEIGFDGLLLSDDLNMNALKGSLRERAVRAFDAGIDILLHCSGKMDEMKDIASAIPQMSEKVIYRVKQGAAQLPDEDSIPVLNNISQKKDELASLLELLD
ncbi:beta-N-acetylhexosaminidase [Sneathiella sp. P13V-1]|uniref:beta-N-acetylhexosaminidase n=1 Tax=Sneathiella sp. P13V-1 TaxID=2697366 RepID=UPI00187B5A93|nr:beta-N-acetylhexosaminidase [Sneathiella sp. P13V-1]MBE7637687.1 beta-N-acetylhexosaminidase [Sneathiella sp. P13V-1]